MDEKAKYGERKRLVLLNMCCDETRLDYVMAFYYKNKDRLDKLLSGKKAHGTNKTLLKNFRDYKDSLTYPYKAPSNLIYNSLKIRGMSKTFIAKKLKELVDEGFIERKERYYQLRPYSDKLLLKIMDVLNKADKKEKVYNDFCYTHINKWLELKPILKFKIAEYKALKMLLSGMESALIEIKKTDKKNKGKQKK